MNFIGNSNQFNDYVRTHAITDYTIVSGIGGDIAENLVGDKFILIMPIDSENQYYQSTSIGYQKMIESGILDGSKIYTTIYLFMHEYIDPKDVVEIINTFDKTNLVDNIWVYPKLDNHVCRDNKVENLYWQKINKN